MCVDDAGKALAATLSPGCFLEQIVILREQDPANLQRPIQKFVILPSRRAILLRR